MNILHLVLGCKNSHYSSIETAANDTWMKNTPPNIKTIFMYGGKRKIYYDDKQSFYVDKPESIELCSYKTICAYETFLEHDFDYVYRTNCTGYYDLNIVNDFLKNKPKQNFYCGIMGNHNGIKFASGSSYFLSKDLVKRVVDNKDILYSYGLPGECDDVIIGKFMESIGVEINPMAKRMNLNPSEINQNLDMTHYHYRIFNKGCAESLYKIHKLKSTYKK